MGSGYRGLAPSTDTANKVRIQRTLSKSCAVVRCVLIKILVPLAHRIEKSRKDACAARSWPPAGGEEIDGGSGNCYGAGPHGQKGKSGRSTPYK